MIGVGIDLVEMDRFRIALDRTPGIIGRCFTPDEQAYALKKRDPTERFAVRFAAKEAVMKAMGVGIGQVRLCDIEVRRDDAGRPSVQLHGTAAQKAVELGITQWKISLTHADHAAEAIAIAL